MPKRIRVEFELKELLDGTLHLAYAGDPVDLVKAIQASMVLEPALETLFTVAVNRLELYRAIMNPKSVRNEN